MIVFITGLIGTGKSTVAAIIAAHKGMYLFDMDNEFPEEYRKRHRKGEVVPAEDVKAYQRPMVERLLDLAQVNHVVVAGFFLDHELPTLLDLEQNVFWINLITDDKDMLIARIAGRSNHFAGIAVLEDNWPEREAQIIGHHRVDCGQALSDVVEDCLNLIELVPASS